MNNLTFTQNTLIKSLEDLALKIYEAEQRGEKSGVSISTAHKLNMTIDNTLCEIRGVQIWWKAYIDGELQIEECLTKDICERKAEQHHFDYITDYPSEPCEDGSVNQHVSEVKIVAYNTETDEVIEAFEYTIDDELEPEENNRLTKAELGIVQ